MSTHSSHQARSQITQPDNLNGRRQTPPGDFYIASESPGANMGPPTFSYDPSLDAWQYPSVLSPRPDELLLPSNKFYPQLHERSSLPITSGNSIHQSDDFRLPSIRGENNSMARWNNDIGPWTPYRHTGSTGQSLMIQPHARFTMQRPSPYGYRDSARSEVSVSTTGQPLHDSAYDSRSFVSNSESSLDHRDASRSCPSDTVDLNGLPYGVGSNVSQDDHHSSLESASDTSYRPRTSASLACQYEQCTHVSRNNSEHKKHVSRHSKPHKCKNCSKSFSTLNDTERHMKSVHKIAPKNGTDRSFRCAALNCTRKDKIWPRLDNFRQHCNRIHKGENIDELVRKSAITYSVQPWNAGPGSSGTVGSAEQYSLSSNHERSNYTTLAHVSLSPGVSSPIGMDPQYDVRVDHIWQGNASNDPAFVSVTQATDRVVEHFATTNTNTHSSILDKAACHTHVRNTYSSPDASLLQVPSNKRQRMPDNPQGRESQMNEKRQKTLHSAVSEVAVVHQTVQERPTDTRSSCNNLDAIYTSAKDSGASEEQLSLITRALTIRGERSTNDHPMHQINSEGIALETKKKPIECDQCHKKMARRCDLRKHNKRHTRPYGCTFATCSKAFGSKNDWKRHENTRHYQIETWRCHEPNPRSQINQCAKIFYRREQFQAHLKDTHSFKDDEMIRDQCKKYRIGRNGQSGFWCGFCKKIVTLKHKGLEAWDERFDHIDKEHFRLGQRIDDHWYPLDKDIPIGSLPSAAEPDSDAPNSPPGNDDSDEDRHEDENLHEGPAPKQNDVPEGPPPEYQMTAKDAYVTKYWYCCMCQDGPNNVSVVKKCNNCSHGRCRACGINKGEGAPAGFPHLTL